ncbi:uncharacterized protein [Salvelinus sp. IW2-2015]|uniref:uncharacterized protein n=1 Tax=Salvelinus sp. IW2-2015 TaxID=2691554 RepID=UPI000CDF890B|nr:uncharacterized protein LOC111958968 [Salvelinus alpinus]
MTTFHIVLIVIILLKVPHQAFCRVWVDQNPVVTSTLGQKVSMGCRVLSDSGELITGCRAEWYINTATHGQRKVWREMGDLPRFKGRFQKTYDLNTTDTSILMIWLELNDIGYYFCTLHCCVNGKDKQYHGNGTRLLLSEAKPTPYGLIFTSVIPGNTTKKMHILGAEEENTSEMQLFYFYAFLAVKLLVIIVLGGLTISS